MDKKVDQSQKPTIELEVSGSADWTDCTIDSVVGYSGRPTRLELELFEKKKDSSIGRSVPSGKVTLVYQNGVAKLEHIDLSSCDKASQFEVRLDVKGQIYASKPASIRVSTTATHGKASSGHSHSSHSNSRLRLGVEGDSVEGPGFIAVVPIETVDQQKHPNADSVKVRLVKGRDVEFRNKESNAVIAGATGRSCQLTTTPDEPFLLALDFNGQMEVDIEIDYLGAHEKRRLKLQYPI